MNSPMSTNQGTTRMIPSMLLVVSLLFQTCNSFLTTTTHQQKIHLTSSATSTSTSTTPLLYASSDDNESTPKSFQTNNRWSSLSPAVKARIVDEAQQRAIRNKKKREPIAEKKRKLLMRYKEAQRKAKKSARIPRPLATHSPDRIALTDVIVGDVYNGTVISLTDFGAYVDIGSGCDGLLHVSQMTREEFVEHPRQVVTPGMEVDVRVLRVSPDLKKMQLTMLPEETLAVESAAKEERMGGERIALEGLGVDDELWGEIRRVTAFGAYVEVGAVVDGWLHFMDHPLFGNVPGAKPKEFMEVGQRIRCWVSGVDLELKRVKLTANRPEDLPGPRREIRKSVVGDDDADYY